MVSVPYLIYVVNFKIKNNHADLLPQSYSEEIYLSLTQKNVLKEAISIFYAGVQMPRIRLRKLVLGFSVDFYRLPSL